MAFSLHDVEDVVKFASYLPPHLRDRFLAAESLPYTTHSHIFIRHAWKEAKITEALMEELITLPLIGETRALWLCAYSDYFPHRLTYFMARPKELLLFETAKTFQAHYHDNKDNIPVRVFSPEAIQSIRTWAKPFYPGDDKDILKVLDEKRPSEDKYTRLKVPSQI